MKRYLSILLVALLLVGCGEKDKVAKLEAENQALKVKLAGYEPAVEPSLAYKFAALAAEKPISQQDTSVAHAKSLLDLAAKQYNITPDEAANMSLRIADLAKKSSVNANPLEILEGATIYGAVDSKQWKKDKENFAKFGALYVANRTQVGASHEVAVRSLVALQTSIINTGG
ncbi:hypothetical protein [Paludibacterium sp. B53371]|uniref:hypothetical protein n=1 Tax=Paludibacterium sp. B53371 TaxID=2806263 RepID=UPI001C043354|nr:hypothetical protein [Paludibacterium sp. B53371]